MSAHNAEYVSVEDYEKAVAEVFGWYPYDVFPADSTSTDGLSASMARRTCVNIVQQAWRIARARNDGPVCPMCGENGCSCYEGGI